MKDEPIVLAHVAWMDRYVGDTHTIYDANWNWDNAGHDPDDSGEQYLFANCKGNCYGYVPRFFRNGRRRGFKRLDLKNLAGTKQLEKFGPVTVVWTATPPFGNDRVIVGWYRNATAYERPIQSDSAMTDDYYYFTAPYAQATRVPATKRSFAIALSRNSDIGGPGQDSIHYASLKSPQLATRIRRYMDGFQTNLSTSTYDAPNATRVKSPRQPDVPKRLEVEQRAMAATRKLFEKAGWDTAFVHLDKIGWDMRADRNNEVALVEIKGLSSSTISIELTANEYTQSKRRNRGSKTNYVIAIVTDALEDRRQRVWLYRRDGNVWCEVDSRLRIEPNGTRLRLDREVTSARFYVAD